MYKHLLGRTVRIIAEDYGVAEGIVTTIHPLKGMTIHTLEGKCIYHLSSWLDASPRGKKRFLRIWASTISSIFRGLIVIDREDYRLPGPEAMKVYCERVNG